MEKEVSNNGLKFFDENRNLAVEIVEDTFNSDIFHIKMGNLHLYDNKSDLFIVETEAVKNGFDHLSIRVSTDDKETLIKLLESKYLLVDTLVTYKFDCSKTVLNEMTHKCIIRDYQEKDLSELINFAQKSFKIDRFHSDPSLDNTYADDYYAKWIENSCKGYSDRVVVAELDGEAVGFTTCKLPDAEGNSKIVLSAVSEKSRGKGVYTSMIHEGLKWLQDKSKYITVGTQINNYPVQKTWNNLGLYLTESSYVLHKRVSR